jgi:NADP-dependent 3-hydroxy acid dehydrogenase YdfG
MASSPRIFLVTGATSGIGEAVAQRLLRDGHRVVGVGRDFSKTELSGPTFEAEPLDLSNLELLPARLEEIRKRHPGIEGLVLAAGRGLLGGFEEQSFGQIRQLIDLDLTAQIFCARSFLPGFKRRGRGDLVFLGSEAARVGRRNGAVYCAAKFALRGFAQALREESAKRGVRVTLINPGMVRTPFFDELPITPGPEPQHALEAEDIAATVAMVLAARPGIVFDEIDLSPLQRAVVHRR